MIACLYILQECLIWVRAWSDRFYPTVHVHPFTQNDTSTASSTTVGAGHHPYLPSRSPQPSQPPNTRPGFQVGGRGLLRATGLRRYGRLTRTPEHPIPSNHAHPTFKMARTLPSPILRAIYEKICRKTCRIITKR